MAKTCAMCGKTLGFFANKAQLKDGYMCENCLKSGGLEYYDNYEGWASKSLIDEVKNRADIAKKFHTTNKFGRIKLDMSLRAFKLNGSCYQFSKLLSYSYREDPENQRISQHDGKAGGAVVGGIVGGLGGGFVGRAVGATVGAAIGNTVGGMFSSVCNYMYININLSDAVKKKERLSFITEKTRVSSQEYKDAAKEARDCLEALEIITRCNEEDRRNLESGKQQQRLIEESTKTVFVQKQHMTAEEINRELTTYMAMKNGGLITEEEYNAKKKQLLSMK